MIRHPEKRRRDLNRAPTVGQSYGSRGERAGEDAATASGRKEVHDLLPDWNDAGLEQAEIVPERAQPLQGATCFDLKSPETGDLTARGGTTAVPGQLLVPRDRTSYDPWGRLTSARTRGQLDNPSAVRNRIARGV